MHELLEAQLTAHFGDVGRVPLELRPLFDGIDGAYQAREASSGAPNEARARRLPATIPWHRHETIVREIKARSSELEAILESLPDSYARIDERGIFVDFRRPKGRDYAIPVGDLVGHHYRDTLPAEAAAAWERAIAAANASGQTTVFEFVLPTPKGLLNREARFTSFVDGQVIAVIRSTTREKKMQAQLMVADRLASLGTLSAGVAHEINNPLMFLLANLEFIEELLPALLADRGAPHALAVLASLEEAKRGGRRVEAIARDLLSFARESDDGLVRVDVHAAIVSALKIARLQIEPRARVARDLRDVPPVRGNEGRLVQVFVNLLVNAAHAIEPGHPTDNEIRVSTEVDAQERVVVTVADTGCGIPDDVIRRIFDPFFTTKGVGVGTGLGLSICHGIVKGLGGELRVESVPGRGTKFFVVLPASREASTSPETSSPKPR